MKEYKIEYTYFANIDLADIWRYMSEYDKDTADNFVLDIKNKIIQLKNFPFSGALKEGLDKINEDVRFLVFKKYNIIYEVNDEIALILRILHGSQEVKNYL